ncbi:CpsD/CapB family tyrosine-protein kinase [Anaerostipes faecalis]|uniref:CpsD/CapB family tyrosine-protein kinase n=1 Tax=Anaerostipes faecalis TaxID=2738446 RepID=UPI003F00254F
MGMKKIKMQIPDVTDYRMTEGLNQLKTNIAFCGDGINSITITSSVSDEGKSSVAFSLARSLSENDKRVLFVDGDLRKSSMVGKYHIEGADKGLSHYLTGQATKDQVIYETEKEGLYMTVAGPLSLDPTSLLNSELFGKFMEEVKKEFDYVIVDAPPLGLVIDAVIIGQKTDGTVLVIEQGVIKRKLVQDILKQLNRGNIRVLGAVLNKVDFRKDAYGHYKSDYGYYGEDNKQNHN